jgi:DNA-binding PadR family transcriptional regulator
MTDKILPEEIIPLRPVIFEILLLLNERPLHGYGIMKEVAGRSGGRTILGPGTLYRTLKEMQHLGLVAPTRKQAGAEKDDDRRRYYRITKHGHRVAAAEAARMAALVGAAQAGNLISDSKQA